MSNQTTNETIAQITDQSESPRASYRVLDSLRSKMSHDALRDLGTRLSDATSDFPELHDETITLGWLHPDASAKARAYSHNRLIVVPADQYVTDVTLYHELGHLAIRKLNEQGEDHPKTSEEYCSIFAMSRMPPNAVDEQRIPYLGHSEKPTERFPEICKDALEYRENKRNYIQKCKEWLDV